MGAFRVSENTMRVIATVEQDELRYFRTTRYGHWVHWYDYITREGTWIWRPLTEHLQEKQVQAEETKLHREEQYPLPSGFCPECGKPFHPEGYCESCDA